MKYKSNAKTWSREKAQWLSENEEGKYHGVEEALMKRRRTMKEKYSV